MERDEQVHEQLIASLEETEVEYNRIRQMHISRIEALQESIEKDQHLLKVTQSQLQAVLASREVRVLFVSKIFFANNMAAATSAAIEG